MKTILIYFAYKYDGNWDKIYAALDNKERVSLKNIMMIESKIKNHQWQVITILDFDYPNQLKLAYKPPFVLWYRGDKAILKQAFICLASNKNIKNKENGHILSFDTKQFMQDINQTYGLVSLLYFDFDYYLLQSPIIKNYLIILHYGFDFVENYHFKNNYCLLTEYPPNTLKNNHNIIATNRLISAFANALIILNFYATKKVSYQEKIIINLIDNFSHLGKDIFCFFSNNQDNGDNNMLIKQGIKLITNIKDLQI